MLDKRVLFLVFVIGGFLVMSTTSQARGIRNNNPGNIRHGSAQWDGMRETQTDAAFVQFVDPVYGIRALSKLLLNYDALYGLNTVEGIISRWAPSNENNTAAYVFSVAARLGVAPDAVIDVEEMLPGLVAAIIVHENGVQPYSVAQIDDGIARAVA